MTLLAELEARISGMAPADRAKLEKMVAGELSRKWSPLPGPQTDAMRSKADVLLYGGQGGGGKTDLGLGLAFTEHRRSLILRRKYVNLGALTDRAIEINGSRDGFNGSPPPSIKTADGRTIQFAGCQHLGDEQDWQGQPFDLKVFDEATQFLEQMVRFHLGWLRTTDTGQRVRALLATNPPVDASGEWIIGMFRPWLDPMHHKPAKHGELRWFVTAPDGSDLEVDGPETIQLPGSPTPSIPTSRSFIPARLKDNPYLIDTGYQAQLDALPEPTRSAVRDGNFMLSRGDADRQVIPSAWVDAAMARWKPPEGKRMMVIFCDVAQGGADKSTTAALHEDWVFGPLDTKPGKDTQDGPSIVTMITQRRRDQAVIGIDCTGGWGGSASDHFRTHNQIEVARVVSSKKSDLRDPHTGYGYRNIRSEMWWEFRIALDPSNAKPDQPPISLPPSPTLRAQLCAPTYTDSGGNILIESKDDIRDRLGSSTDEADAVIGAWKLRSLALSRLKASSNQYPTTYLKPQRPNGARYPTTYRKAR